MGYSKSPCFNTIYVLLDGIMTRAAIYGEDGDLVLYSMHVSSLEVSSVSKTAAGEGSQLRNDWFEREENDR